MILHDPYWLLMLLFCPLVLFLGLRSQNRPGIRYSDIGLLKMIKPSPAVRLRFLPSLLAALALAFLALALARPQKGREDTRIESEGIDIMLALDTSGSMVAEDLAKDRNRLDVVKEVTEDFIKGRQSDRIGLVVYGGEAYTQCPPTLDYGTLQQFLEKCQIGMADENYTAIGDALATALLRLKDNSATSRVVILLTDGMNNHGAIDPMTAAQIAKAQKVKIYTIGAGTRGMAPVPGQDFFGRKILRQMPVEIDENLLKNIATTTGGRYFRATDKDKLKEIYKEIDELEKSKVETFKYMEWQEKYYVPAGIALGLLLLACLLECTLLRRLP